MAALYHQKDLREILAAVTVVGEAVGEVVL